MHARIAAQLRNTGRLALLATLLLLAACATIPSAGIAPDGRLAAGHGLVVVQVVNNTEKIGTYLDTWSEVMVVDLDRRNEKGEPLIATIPALTDGLSSTRVFVGSLAPGRYRLSSLFAWQEVPGVASYSAGAPTAGALGDFTVEAERLTSLGTVLYQPLHADPLATTMVTPGGRTGFIVSRLDDTAALDEFVSLRYPAAASAVASQPPLGWREDAYAPERATLRDAIRSYAIPGRGQSVDADGAMVFGGRLGMLHRRAGDGAWSRTHVGGNRELLTYRAVGSEVFAGGERGQVCRAAAFDGAWRCDSLPQRDQNVVWLGSGVPGVLHALAVERGRTRLYRSPLDGAFAWTLVTEFGTAKPVAPLQSSWVKAAPAAALLDGTRLRVADAEGSHAIDLSTGARNVGTWPKLVRLVEQQNGMLVASPYSGWSGTNPPMVSSDRGETWATRKRLGVFHTLPYVFADGDLLAADNDASFVFIGWRKHENVAVLRAAPVRDPVQRTVGSVQYGCSEIVNEVSRDAELIARCFDGTLLASTDEGATWHATYPRSVRGDSIPSEFFVPQAME